MPSLMLKTLSSLALKCPRGPFAAAAWTSCGVHPFSSRQTQTPAQQNLMVPSTTKLTPMVKSDLSTQSYTMIYRLPHIRLLKAISQLKVVQTGITVVILPPIYYYYLQGDVPFHLVGYSTGLALFAGVMLYAASHFFRSVVGIMYLDSTQTTLKISHLTFWGKRNDLFLPVSDVMTLGDTGDTLKERILKLKTFSGAHMFYYSIYYGRITNKEGFEKVFGALKQ